MTLTSLDKTIHIQNHQTPLGEIMIGVNDAGLCLLEFTQQAKLEKKLQHLEKKHSNNIKELSHPTHTHVQQQLDEYFEGHRQSFNIPLCLIGTVFQQKVWETLLSIPFGQTICYQEQSQALNQASAIRAVASANGANLISIIIPCHRVIGKNGSLTGYAGGTDRKAWLLAHEHAEAMC